jgi:hypothetical protein
MNISLNTINDSDVCKYMWERRGDRFVFTKDPEFFPKTRFSEAPPPDVLKLMDACHTDRVGADFFGTLHPLHPSPAHRAAALRQQEEAVRAERYALEQEARSRDIALQRRMHEERIRRENAEILGTAAVTLLRGFGRLMRSF